MEVRRLGEDEGQLFETALRDLLPPEDLPHGPGNRAHLARALADPNCYFLVCIEENATVGYLSAYRFPAVEHDGFLVYLYDIVVRPEHRRRGIATRLIELLKERCREDRVARIWVGTSVQNTAAQQTFEGTGAQKVSETYVEYIYDLDDRAVQLAVATDDRRQSTHCQVVTAEMGEEAIRAFYSEDGLHKAEVLRRADGLLEIMVAVGGRAPGGSPSTKMVDLGKTTRRFAHSV